MNQPIDYALLDGAVTLHPAFFNAQKSDACFAALRRETAWRQSRIKLFGQTRNEPRLTAWHGDAGKIYSYSNIVLHPLPWTPLLLEIKNRVDEAAHTAFNSVLLNLYRNGRDSNGWHQDNEPELGANPVIASVSFGAARRFQMRHKIRQDLKLNLELPHGSLLLMTDATQHHWQHQVPKTVKPVGERINLTFRVIR